MAGESPRLTTPPKPVRIEQVFPELRSLARTTVRLHPRPGRPGTTESSLGGPLLWPADEPWPHCAEFDRHYAFERDLPSEPLPLVPILQLFARDVPELPFPAGTDVCQVLWCPLDHDPLYCPDVQVRWRDSASITRPRTEPPPVDLEYSADNYLPRPCALAPERVTEFPHYSDLDPELARRITAWEEQIERRWRYHYHLSVAPGTKVGGWVHWIQDPIWLTCECGHALEHLLTIASGESDGQSWKTWTPAEEHPGMDANGRPRRRLDRRPADLMIGDVGDVYLFTCPQCEHRPITTLTQCS
ncbi:DUF1963 domain-containing protein [Thermomonospora cellulosilytica]|uniref:DUF1963 domain-containing protein n=1 Tax=Thermomonospora cellulosilytica TaxID=1411118 RepID=A0A7W3MWF0_9ACTN|nr:DUF1963 domain-containing protein [Thermomonospora cellulosilytica]MBA9003079.1 hypothetical protein [Thermomonospora cellulosilytica]